MSVLESIEAKLDVAILMSGGMSREDAEAEVYGAKILETLRELQATLRETRERIARIEEKHR